MSRPARYWHQMPSGQLKCDLCPRACRFSEGQRGFCYVRKREGNQLINTTWGQPAGFQLDPIEKKPLNHFYPGSKVLSFGTPGCNLACKFCQNWDLSKAKEFERATDHASSADIARLAKDQGAKSVAMTYNDPVIYIEYAHEVGRACKEQGVKVVLVTAGYLNNEAHQELFEYVDAANIDLKAFSEGFYRGLCKGSLKPVLNSLLFVREFTNVWLELTNLIIPKQNDDPKEIKAMCQWIYDYLGADTPLHFSAFHPDYQLITTPKTSLTTLHMAYEIAKEVGLNYVYLGNVHDQVGDATFCPNCGEIVIQRDWYKIQKNSLAGQSCAKCSNIIAGHF